MPTAIKGSDGVVVFQHQWAHVTYLLLIISSILLPLRITTRTSGSRDVFGAIVRVRRYI